MLMHSQNSTRFVSPSSLPPVRRITYTRWQGSNRILKGTIKEEREVAVKRWPGVVVTEYRVKPDAGQTNLSEHWVNESDVIEIIEKPICARCNDVGYISLRGDDDCACPVCQDIGEVVY